MTRGVKEFYLFVGTDDRDSCWRQTFASSTCNGLSWTWASPWVEERGEVDIAVASAKGCVVAYGEEGMREWGRVDVQEDLVLAAGRGSDGGDR